MGIHVSPDKIIFHQRRRISSGFFFYEERTLAGSKASTEVRLSCFVNSALSASHPLFPKFDVIRGTPTNYVAMAKHCQPELFSAIDTWFSYRAKSY